MKDAVHLPKDGLPPAAYLGKTCFEESHRFFHVSQYISEDFPTSYTLGRMPNCPIIFEVELIMMGFHPCYGWTMFLLPWCLQSTLVVVVVESYCIDCN